MDHLKPMSLSDRKCPGGTTRTHPPRLRRDCANCKRLRPFGEEVEDTDIDPVGAWTDATAFREGFCRERIALLSAEQMRGMDEMGHVQTVPCAPQQQKTTELGARSGTQIVERHCE